MNMPLVLLNRRRRAGGFSPYVALFANDERGVFLDPSDTANLSWRRNLLTFTEQFDNAAWFKTASTTVTANQGVAPDGTTTADLVTSGGAAGYIYPATGLFASAGGATYTYSAYFKAGTATSVQLLIAATATYTGTYNLSTGIATTGTANTTVSMTDVGSGWYRCVLTCAAVANTVYTEAQIGRVALGLTFQVWGAQLEVGSTASTYQVITDLNTEVRANFPNATLYQDTAGTTPVTTPGQSVALALDKSRGLVLGPELVTNRDFSAGSTGWDVPAGWAIAGGVATGSTTSASLVSLSSVTANRSYRVEFDVVTYTSGTLFVRVGTGTAATTTSAGRKSFILVSSNTAGVEFYGGLFAGTIDNISVKELPGNHATQATAGSRPLYALLPANGVRNLANGSADVGNNAVWLTGTTQNGITMTKVASGFDVDGLPYVDVRYQGTSTSTNHDQILPFSFAVQSGAAGQSATCSVIARVISGSVSNVLGLRARMSEETAPSTFIGIALGTPVTASTDTVTTATRTLSTGNQFRATLSLDFNTASAIDVTYRVKAMQVEMGSTRTAYQFNYSNVNIAQPPFAQVGALLFDGVDDFLQTPSVDFAGGGISGPNILTGTWTLTVDGGTATATESPAGTLNLTGDGTNGANAVQSVTTQAGRTYRIDFTVGSSANTISAGTSAFATDLIPTTVMNVGVNCVYFTATTTTSFILFRKAGAALSTTSGITVREAIRPADKMTVFAGVRKVDSAGLTIVELGPIVDTTNGSFALYANAPGGPNIFQLRSRGTSLVPANLTVNAPVTGVVTGIMDISGKQNTIRVNGVSVQNTADQGTGNYRNDILYIGRRAGTSFPFIGYLFSLIVRGAATSTDVIGLTERWVNSRTGAY